MHTLLLVRSRPPRPIASLSPHARRLRRVECDVRMCVDADSSCMGITADSSSKTPRTQRKKYVQATQVSLERTHRVLCHKRRMYARIQHSTVVQHNLNACSVVKHKRTRKNPRRPQYGALMIRPFYKRPYNSSREEGAHITHPLIHKTRHTYHLVPCVKRVRTSETLTMRPMASASPNAKLESAHTFWCFVYNPRVCASR